MNTYRVTSRASSPKAELEGFSEYFSGCNALSETSTFETIFKAENDEMAIKVAKSFALDVAAENGAGHWSVELHRGDVVGALFFSNKIIYLSPETLHSP